MIINEITEYIPGMQDLGDDQSTEFSLRQTRLTLKQLNKLRKMNDMRTFEKEAKLQSIRSMYGSSDEDSGEESPF